MIYGGILESEYNRKFRALPNKIFDATYKFQKIFAFNTLILYQKLITGGYVIYVNVKFDLEISLSFFPSIFSGFTRRGLVDDEKRGRLIKLGQTG